ncbi:UNVERIFIED_CONTAM: hypothetical protein NCL1_50444 [Trichonephila clavipes]
MNGFSVQVLVLSVFAVSSVVALKGYDDQFISFNVRTNICVGNYQAYNPHENAFKNKQKQGKCTESPLSVPNYVISNTATKEKN